MHFNYSIDSINCWDLLLEMNGKINLWNHVFWSHFLHKIWNYWQSLVYNIFLLLLFSLLLLYCIVFYSLFFFLILTNSDLENIFIFKWIVNNLHFYELLNCRCIPMFVYFNMLLKIAVWQIKFFNIIRKSMVIKSILLIILYLFIYE